MTQPTHAALVKRAGRWLRNSARIAGRECVQKVRCGVVMTESMTWEQETPDAVGWWNGGVHSIMIEVKVSRGDFLADAKKPFRQHPETGVGDYRYYLTPPGLLEKYELPSRWGLLESTGRTVKVVRLSSQFDKKSTAGELQMLYSVGRRSQVKTEVKT